MRVAVTGAAGFIGGHLVRRLAGRGHTVRSVVRPTPEADRLGDADVRYADIGDAEALASAFDGCDAIVHLAGLTTRHHASAWAYEAVNVGGTRAVVEAAQRAGAGRLVVGSTVGVYGRAASGQTPRPNTPYRRSKHAAEAVALAADGLDASVVRLPATLGPGATGWLGWVRGVASGRARLPGDGCARKTVADVADGVEGLALVMEAGEGGRTYDLAGPAPVTIGELTARWASGVGAEVRRSAVPTAALRAVAWAGDLADRVARVRVPKAHEAEFFAVDTWHPTSEALLALGYAPRVGVTEAVGRTLDGYRAASLLPEPASATVSFALPL